MVSHLKPSTRAHLTLSLQRSLTKLPRPAPDGTVLQKEVLSAVPALFNKHWVLLEESPEMVKFALKDQVVTIFPTTAPPCNTCMV